MPLIPPTHGEVAAHVRRAAWQQHHHRVHRLAQQPEIGTRGSFAVAKFSPFVPSPLLAAAARGLSCRKISYGLDPANDLAPDQFLR